MKIYGVDAMSILGARTGFKGSLQNGISSGVPVSKTVLVSAINGTDDDEWT